MEINYWQKKKADKDLEGKKRTLLLWLISSDEQRTNEMSGMAM